MQVRDTAIVGGGGEYQFSAFNPFGTVGAVTTDSDHVQIHCYAAELVDGFDENIHYNIHVYVFINYACERNGQRIMRNR